ncbi:MAG TPA: PDZ domain-containing protein [Bryobacteraceae bacterium]
MLRSLLLFLAPVAFAASVPSIEFKLSIPNPSAKSVHVTMRCHGLEGEWHDFQMSAWMPGFYRLLYYADKVSKFHAADDHGKPLDSEKTTRNTWRIVTAGSHSAILDYDVAATTRFAAQSLVDESRAYLAPPSLFLYVDNRLDLPATVEVDAPAAWTSISTGLDPVKDHPHTFRAPDVDVLMDTPILLGKQELLHFEVNRVPHTIALEDIPPAISREQITKDLQKIVQASVDLIGDIPYQHYTFLLMGQGNGGIEHLNSSSIAFNGKNLSTPEGYRKWLSYVAHEYFHHYNVKRIRPIALGPFDYSRENLTHMLWVSEGLSVYYQDLLCLRSGLFTRAQYLDVLRAAIAKFENAPGHRYQSAVESSWTTWSTGGVGNDRNTTISYYDNGGMLGFILDLSIRHASANRKSLDDVMRALYRNYYQQRHRGFTDLEFREECERAAGTSLPEVFEYAASPREMDYAKYLAYAGLLIDAAEKEGKGAFLGANLQARDTGLTVVDVDPASPAAKAGLNPGDTVLEVEGTKATVKVLSDAIAAKKPGDHLKLHLDRGDIEAELAITPQRTYTIRESPQRDELQNRILANWLR